ncbi:pyrroline-5-carboxylate reductase 3 isoform X2 [Hemibagrus wyckioides]|uniref:pyrroline-5-carboxylate reductase 3 isoform X2 n=1 Tax=Hemibagrus wyckioides TaxID=337641 RepID=UPI00266D3C1C|nr:pyrroline-5-carboxylate reductase 3 isoform X2 [Hemibagrus wyckioides]
MDELPELKIGFIGAGNMAYGIAQGILRHGNVVASNVIVSAPSKNNFSRFQAMGVAVTHSNEEVIHHSRLVFLAVKPHLIPTVLSALSQHVTPQHIVVSMAAGVTLATLEGEGALLLACGTGVKQEVASMLKSLLSPCGLVEVGPESWIDAHTGLSGSGVAFVYVFAEALAEGAVKMGMPSVLAQRFAAQTILGAGYLLRDGEKHPAQLKAEVCTPGGTTVYGLHALEKGGLRAAVMGAVEAATERARELGCS